MSKDYREEAKVFKALCDEKRLRILELLKNEEKCACVLIDTMNIGQSALSYHMKILCDSKIIDSRQDGKWTYYRLSEKGANYAFTLLKKYTTSSLEETGSCCKQ